MIDINKHLHNTYYLDIAKEECLIIIETDDEQRVEQEIEKLEISKNYLIAYHNKANPTRLALFF